MEEKNKYRVKGKFLTLVTGSLENCSAALPVVVGFVAAIRTARALELLAANPDELLNMHRRFLISSFGLFAARLWARHIHDRFRDAASAQAPSYALQLPSPGREVIRAFHVGTSHPRRAEHRGFCRGAKTRHALALPAPAPFP